VARYVDPEIFNVQNQIGFTFKKKGRGLAAGGREKEETRGCSQGVRPIMNDFNSVGQDQNNSSQKKARRASDAP
jgi:hypothetical protein